MQQFRRLSIERNQPVFLLALKVSQFILVPVQLLPTSVNPLEAPRCLLADKVRQVGIKGAGRGNITLHRLPVFRNGGILSEAVSGGEQQQCYLNSPKVAGHCAAMLLPTYPLQIRAQYQKL